MSEVIKNLKIKRAYLARLFSLCNQFAKDDISVSIHKNNIIIGGMNPVMSFELAINEPQNKALSYFFSETTNEPEDIQFTVSKDDFSNILAPFSRTGGSKRPKEDTDIVSLEIKESGITFIQDNLHHESEKICIKFGEGTWNLLPSEKWDFSIDPNLLSAYINRMVASGGPKIEFEQEENVLWIKSDAGREKLPMEAIKPQSNRINISRITLEKVKSQLKDYEKCKLGIRNHFLLIEGYWDLGICKWKLDAM